MSSSDAVSRDPGLRYSTQHSFNTAQSLEDKTAGEGPAEASDEEKEASLWSRCSSPTDPQRPQHVTLRRHVFSLLTTSCHMTAHRHFLPKSPPPIHQRSSRSSIKNLRGGESLTCIFSLASRCPLQDMRVTALVRVSAASKGESLTQYRRHN